MSFTNIKPLSAAIDVAPKDGGGVASGNSGINNSLSSSDSFRDAYDKSVNNLKNEDTAVDTTGNILPEEEKTQPMALVLNSARELSGRADLAGVITITQSDQADDASADVSQLAENATEFMFSSSQLMAGSDNAGGVNDQGRIESGKLTGLLTLISQSKPVQLDPAAAEPIMPGELGRGLTATINASLKNPDGQVIRSGAADVMGSMQAGLMSGELFSRETSGPQSMAEVNLFKVDNKSVLQDIAGAAPEPPSVGGTVSGHGVDSQLAARIETLKINVPIAHPEWGQGLVNSIKWMIGSNIRSAEIHLEPANLGPLDVKISVENNHTVVTFMTAHMQVRDALEGSSQRLRDALDDNGSLQVNFNMSRDGQAEQRGDNPQREIAAPAVRSAGEEDVISITSFSDHNNGVLLDIFA